MTTSQLSVFFATLSLACWAGTLSVIALVVARLRSANDGLARVVASVSASSLWLAWVVALVTSGGSLYYSLGAHFDPCELCWYQRICMYPLSAILLVAAVRGDRRIWRYAMPQALVGAVIAIYHTQLQAFPKQVTFCSSVDPCTARYVWEFGFVSLPFMSLAAFGFIITMMVVAARLPAASILDRDEPDDTPPAAGRLGVRTAVR